MIEPFARFDLPAILDRVRADAYTLFMAVPTIYVKLIQALEVASDEDRSAVVAGFGKDAADGFRQRCLACQRACAVDRPHWTAAS
jgi:hypothetical protein